jgi:hypothetical protein
VLQLPEHGAFMGNNITIDTENGEPPIAITATGRRGHAALERNLDHLQVRAGDRVTITFHGWRRTADGARRYRHETVRRAG